jgi:hypothetical protein
MSLAEAEARRDGNYIMVNDNSYSFIFPRNTQSLLWNQRIIFEEDWT